MNRLLIPLLIISIGCNPKHNNESVLSPLEKYKSRIEWHSLGKASDSYSFIGMNADSLDYEEAIDKYGKPIYEFDDTVIHGNNIKTDLPDYDLYPLTLERDSVFVRRCWWFLSYKKSLYLYLVFEYDTDSMPAIYGYKYRQYPN